MELLRPGDFTKPFIDLDHKVEGGTRDQPPEDWERLKKEFMKKGRDTCEDEFDVPVSAIAISDASGYDTEKKAWKISFHYVINGKSIRWVDHQKLPGFMNDKPAWWDDVYGHRCMRMVHCVKTTQRHRPLVPLTHTGEDELHCHIIQMLTDEDKTNLISVVDPVEIDEEGGVRWARELWQSGIKSKWAMGG